MEVVATVRTMLMRRTDKGYFFRKWFSYAYWTFTSFSFVFTHINICYFLFPALRAFRGTGYSKFRSARDAVEYFVARLP